jgi:hypothetical protein
MKSHVAKAIERAIANGVCISVYMDDFIGSHSDPAILRAAYDEIRKACLAAGLIPNPDKLVPRLRQLSGSTAIWLRERRTSHLSESRNI